MVAVAFFFIIWGSFYRVQYTIFLNLLTDFLHLANFGKKTKLLGVTLPTLWELWVLVVGESSR